MTYCTWDTETTITSKFKRKASPFAAENWVVTHAFKKKGGAVEEHRFGRNRPPSGWFKQVLAGTRLLVGFNIKFDILHAITNDRENLEAWMEWVAGGGNVWDCQLAEYLLEGMGQKSHMLSLDEVAPRYGGNVKVDEVKLLWAAGVNTPDIEPALLTRYLCGGADEHGVYQMGDIENTEKIFLGQLARARNVGQVRSILLNMGALIAVAEKERNGMYVDKAMGLEIAAELQQTLAELRVTLSQFLPADLPFTFSWSSRFHKSALIFGGKVRYARREYLLKDGSYTFEEDHPQQAYAQKDVTNFIKLDGTLIEDTDWHYLEGQGTAPEVEVFKSGKRQGEPKTTKVKADDHAKPKSRMGEDYYNFPGYTEPSKKWATADPGVYSVGDEVIEELSVRNIPFLQALGKLTKLAKDLGTYYIVTDEKGESKGMLALVDEFGIIHHKINQTSTVTGRFSSSDPNLQNVPKGNNSKIKLTFRSRFGPDGKVIQSDFSSLEVYIQAILTKCKQLIEDLKAGLDMHVKRLAVKEGITYEECLLKCKGNATTPALPEWDYKRTGAKQFSFQRAYGAGAPKISASTGMPLEDVEALIKAEDLEYPEISQFYLDLTEQIKLSRRPTGRVVPHPDLPGVMCHIGEGAYRTPDGKLYSYTEHPAPEFVVKRGTTANFSPTEIKNYIVQGEGGEWMKAAMWLAVRAFYARKNFDHRALLVNTVHDAMYVDAHQDVALEAAQLLHACMEEASTLIEWYFDWPSPIGVPTDTVWGASMLEEGKVPGLTDRHSELVNHLREEYMNAYAPKAR
jgi:DNA polymerase I-like protein with 3'-5' exonuclease and polymerase domains